jgi:crotonobetainyl-CoA:carnitine CoA-transferase CaiB-like acyl-CoA transferase
MSAPLQGIRVIELASFVAAPATGALLVDLGAEVIKVEVPWGEIYRHSTARMMGVDSDFTGSAPFQMTNHGKRSLTLDLALPEAQEALKQVVDTADVLLTNMLPSRLARYGLDPAALLAQRPELIVARLSGYGADGPEADTPAFDYTAYWARSGLMEQLHEAGGSLSFQRPGIGDHSAGLALALAVVAALRTRDAEGHGQVVDVALQNIGYYISGNDMTWALATGHNPPKHDRSKPRNALWNHYPCKDGRSIFLVMIEADRYWATFAEAIGRPELARDERFVDGFARYRNAEELVKILDAVFAEQTMEAWSGQLDAHRLIWAPVRSHAEAAGDATAAARGIFPTVDHPDHGSFKTVAAPFSMSKHPIPGNAPAPALGADTAAVLSEAGVDEETIALLVAASS